MPVRMGSISELQTLISQQRTDDDCSPSVALQAPRRRPSILFFFTAVNLNSPAEDCSYVQTAGKANDFFSNSFVLDCPLCNLPLTTLDNIGCHSNSAQVHQRQFSVHNMKRVKGSLHYACADTYTHTQTCTLTDTLSYSHTQS